VKYWLGLLGLVDLTSRGRPAFSKLMAVAVLGVYTYLGDLPALVAIALLAAAMGRSTYNRFLFARKGEHDEATETPRGDSAH
jgi:ethanolamine transporter EutH